MLDEPKYISMPELFLKEPVTLSTSTENFSTEIHARNHQWISDEPESNGGKNAGPTPHELLLSSLAACTAITVKMYAQRKQWDLQSLNISLNISEEKTNEGLKSIIFRELSFKGNLDTEQRDRLLHIAKICPVAKVLSGSISIESKDVSEI